MNFPDINLALLFPPFVHEYIGNERTLLAKAGLPTDLYFEKASSHTGIDLSAFHETENPMLQDELASQYIAYVFSCACSDLIKNKRLPVQMVCGYSMGIYAALYHVGSVDFHTGLEMIASAYACIEEATAGREFSMATVVGFSEEEIKELISAFSPNVELINRNNPHTFVLSGLKNEIESAVMFARSEGALHTRILPVSSPYHSSFMEKAARNFEIKMNEIQIKDPDIPIISMMNCKTLLHSDEITTELVRNIHHSMNWQGAMEGMLNQKIELFIECGAGESLSKINRFIDGRFKTLPLYKFIPCSKKIPLPETNICQNPSLFLSLQQNLIYKL